MKTAKEVAEEFEFELKALLKKYDTQIEMEIVNQNYLGIVYSIKVYIPEVWKNDKVISESSELDLGTYYTHD